MNRSWRRGIVLPGKREGRTIGFPTINLSPEKIEGKMRIGVHACLVRHGKNVYKSALYYGPRLVAGESHNVLEIHLFDFHGNLYNQHIEFVPVAYIRKALPFKNMEGMRRVIRKDCEKAKTLLDESIVV